MQTASFYGFFKTIIYILAFYYAFKFLARLFFPIIVKKVIQKAGQNFQQHQQSSQSKTNNKQDEIIYNKDNSSKPRETKKVGEYIDYEEID